jgi:hypothetical protein
MEIDGIVYPYYATNELVVFSAKLNGGGISLVDQFHCC